MPYVTLQFGVCGNRLGRSFFSTLNEITSQKQDPSNASFLDETDSWFFTHSDKNEKFARAVLYDTGPEDFERFHSNSTDWSYQNENFKFKYQSGPIGDWALGYLTHGPTFEDDFMELLRKEVERCDELHGFLIFSSIAGGTGTGLSSYVSEKLKDYYSSVSSANIIAWPFRISDCTSCPYSIILSLSALQNSSDAVVVFENEYLEKSCLQIFKEAKMSHLNMVMSEQIANLLLPVTSSNMNPMFNDILAQLVPHPQYKLISIRSAPQEPIASRPFSSYSWSSLLKLLRRMVLYDSVVDEVYGQGNIPVPDIPITPPVSLANLLILRGRGSEYADWNLLHKPSPFYTSWVPVSSRLKMWYNHYPLYGYDRMALLANNGQLSVSRVDDTLKYVYTIYKKRAYVHYYKEYGLTEADLELSMMTVQQIVNSYKDLSN